MLDLGRLKVARNAPIPPLYPRHRPVSASEARAADLRATREFSLPGLVLMEHAARGLAVVAAERASASSPGPIVVACGPGQNGGDGLGAARFLRSFGFPVEVVRLYDRPYRGDAAVEFAAFAPAGAVPTLVCVADVQAYARAHLAHASLVVDALFGVGLDRELDEPARALIEAINACAAPVVAADLPSGLDADTGLPRPVAVEADVTAAMGFVKQGCATALGMRFCGRLVEIDIGLPFGVHGPYRA